LNSHEDRLARRGHWERHFAAGRAEGGDSIANGLAHRNRQHERRFTYSFAAIDNALLRGVLEERDAENLWHVADRGNLVGVW